MITTGTKWFLGLGLVNLVLAWVYGWTTGGNGLGPVTVGYKGAVGDHVGYGLLLASAVVGIGLAVLQVAVRDADAEAEAEVAGTDVVPTVTPAATNWWPPVAAFGVALVAIGLVSQPFLFVFGLITLGIVLVEWTVSAWADRATGDPATNREIRNRLMNPIEFPAAGLLAIAVLVVAFSRVFLAVSKENAVWVATAASIVILVLGVLVASRPKLGANAIVGMVLVGAVVVIGIGVAGAVAGEREFHHVGEEEEGHEPAGEVEGDNVGGGAPEQSAVLPGAEPVLPGAEIEEVAAP
jgi:hypothetical protein